jgi:hypothetical protein
MAREAEMSRLWEVMKREFYEVLPPTIFFFVAFHIVVLDRILLLRQYGLSLSSVAGATVAALLVAKIVLITDKFPFVNRFPDKPLIFNVVWKTAIYVGASLVVHYLEHLIPVWWRMGASLPATRPPLGGDRVAALLGYPALAHRADLRLLRDPRAHSGHRAQAGPDHVLRRSWNFAPVRNH